MILHCGFNGNNKILLWLNEKNNVATLWILEVFSKKVILVHSKSNNRWLYAFNNNKTEWLNPIFRNEIKKFSKGK